MVKNYLKTAFRSLSKHKAFTFINVFGLSIGIAMATLLGRFIQVELSYDQFYQHKNEIYRVFQESEINGRKRGGITGSGLLSPELKASIPEVLLAGRTHRVGSSVLKYEDKQWIENRLAYADNDFLQIIEVKFLEGDPAEALSTPTGFVISAGLAKKIFGEITSLVGRSLIINDKVKRISGVIEDMPGNSHYSPRVGFMSNMAMSTFQWNRVGHVSYVRLQPGADPNTLKAKLDRIVNDYVLPTLPEDSKVQLGFYPVADIWLSTDASQESGGSRSAVYAFSLIAFFMLLLAAINYMNLATARSMQRAREIGVRKVIGARKPHIMTQFLTESILLALISVMLGGFLAEMCTGLFNRLTGKTVEIGFLQNPELLITLIVLGVILGLLAGLYPALFLSAFKPTKVLKSASIGNRTGRNIRRVLVSFQFIISIGLIISTLVVHKQLNYITQKDLGYNPEQILSVRLAKSDPEEIMKSALIALPQISGITATNVLPATGDSGATFTIIDEQKEEHKDIISMASVDYDYLEIMELDLLKGRNFSADFPTDQEAILVNETLVKKYGWKNPIGKSISMKIGDQPEDKFTIIGMVEDFNMLSLYEPVKPFALFLKPKFDWGPQYLLLKVNVTEVSETLANIQTVYESIEKNRPFSAIFVNDYFEQVYSQEIRKAQVYLTFSVLTIVIACIGLLGLATFVLQQRTKEIGIRKVLGASFTEIVRLVSWEFAITILISSLIASPLAYYFMRDWLESFEYRTQMGPWIFFISAITAIAIALITIGAQTFKTAHQNPAETLKYE